MPHVTDHTHSQYPLPSFLSFSPPSPSGLQIAVKPESTNADGKPDTRCDTRHLCMCAPANLHVAAERDRGAIPKCTTVITRQHDTPAYPAAITAAYSAAGIPTQVKTLCWCTGVLHQKYPQTTVISH